MPRKQATSHGIADLVGASRTTVSFVLNNVLGVKISEETRPAVKRDGPFDSHRVE
jgi:DNA-binding LacI/PurR family transcriptional regulator